MAYRQEENDETSTDESLEQQQTGSQESEESGHLLITSGNPRVSSGSDNSGFQRVSNVDQQSRAVGSEPNRLTEAAEESSQEPRDLHDRVQEVERCNQALLERNDRLGERNNALRGRNNLLEDRNNELQRELEENRLIIHSLQKPRKYTKPILVFVICFVIVAVVFLLIWLGRNSGIDDGTPNATIRLGEEIEIKYTVPAFIGKNYEEVNITTPSGGTYTYFKDSRKKRSNEPWQLLTTETSSTEYLFTFSGPTSNCDSGGEYRITFIKDSKEIHSQQIIMQIESQRETSGSIKRDNENEKNMKDFTCEGKGGCEQSFITVHETDHSRSELRDMAMKCESVYDVTTGSKHVCTGKTTKSAIVCYLEGDQPESQVVSECDSLPCKNDGTCTLQDVGQDFTCVCRTGFTGRLCETNIDECSSSPCRNEATCVDGEGSYTCTCKPGYTGVLCDPEINECDGVSCNGGTCRDRVNDYECNCLGGYTGRHCETAINECLSGPCSNGATCMDRLNGYMCICRHGYSGINCAIDINECASHTCVNGASCVDGIGGYTCTCTAGFTGTDCGEEIDECSSSPCKNGGTCEDRKASFHCACTPGCTGITCQEEIDYCEGVTCHHGTCVSMLGYYVCECKEGYTGSYCQSAQPNMNCTDDIECVQNAVCIGHKCTCQDPYIISVDNTACVYGCRTDCKGTTEDFYSIYRNPCGNEFIRCDKGTSYVQPCDPEEVFNPAVEECTCIPKLKADWCQDGALEVNIIGICEKTCSNNTAISTSPQP